MPVFTFCLSFMTPESDLIVDQSVSPFPGGSLHIPNFLLLNPLSVFETISFKERKSL